MVNMVNSKSNNKRNGWIRNLLLPKKKHCPCPSQCRKCEYDVTQCSDNDEMVQGNICEDNKEEQKMPVFRVNPKLGNTKEQKEACLGNTCPMERRGCGFHFYFCIDNVRKSDLARSKITKQIKYVNNNSEDNFISEDIDEVRSKDRSPGNSPRNALSNEYSANNPQNIVSNKNINSTDQNTTKSQHNRRLCDCEAEDWGTHEQQEEKPPARQHEQMSSTTSVKDITITDVTQPGQKIRFISKETHIHPWEHEVEIKSQKMHTDGHKNAGDVSAVDEAPVFKEYEAPQINNRRKSSMKTRSTFVRNSLISLRKIKTYDELDEIAVSQILSKLNHIEDKISELEKNCENQGKRIKNIVGISCNNANSTVSVERLDKNVDSDHNAPCSSKTNGTVVIKFCGDDVVVNNSEQASKSNKSRTRAGSDQLVYHNTFELDAHRIASDSHYTPKPKINGCEDKKIIVQTFHVHSLTSPAIDQPSHMWRRVSEELKLKEALIPL